MILLVQWQYTRCDMDNCFKSLQKQAGQMNAAQSGYWFAGSIPAGDCKVELNHCCSVRANTPGWSLWLQFNAIQ